MAYFPHAYQKMLVGTDGFYSPAGETGLVLTAGQIGVIDSKTNLTIGIGSAASYQDTPLFYLAQGSFHTNDKIGPFHGGYKETVKSKGINPKYVSEFYVVEPADAVQNIVSVSSGVNCTSITCDTTYRLRLDVKGSPALRFLTHNAYLTADAQTGCCDSENSNIDPNVVYLQWADEINASPILKSFIQAKVFNILDSSMSIDPTDESNIIIVSNADADTLTVGDKIVAAGIPANTFVTVIGADNSASSGFANVTLSKAATSSVNVNAKVYRQIETATYTVQTGSAADTNDAHMDLIGAYVDTTFGDCSFAPIDHVELQPVQIYASIVDQTGDPCSSTCFVATETQETFQGRGFGETLVRELILAKRYQQEPWIQDPRLREVLNDTTLTELSRSTKYITYHILHSVPRKSNPSGTMDNDQYLIKIVVTERDSKFEDWMNGILLDAGNHVQLKVLV